MCVTKCSVGLQLGQCNSNVGHQWRRGCKGVGGGQKVAIFSTDRYKFSTEKITEAHSYNFARKFCNLKRNLKGNNRPSAPS